MLLCTAARGQCPWPDDIQWDRPGKSENETFLSRVTWTDIGKM